LSSQAIIFSLIIVRIFRGTSYVTTRDSTTLGTIRFGPGRSLNNDVEETFNKDEEAGAASARGRVAAVSFAASEPSNGVLSFSDDRSSRKV
jgi:hypothetical protein